MALVMTLSMTPADDPAPSERDCMGVRNAHTRLGAELCTPVPIIGPTDWLVHISKVREFNYLAALVKPRVPSDGGLGSMRYSLFQNEHARDVLASSFLTHPSFLACSFFFF